ncbi:L-fucose mutarotase [Brevibacterium siliguriense]|uniref:L-fucose mutarotase n=1 Tax=Brevibacterium siliguriense TaxID=1136497 RepID=A0A1H1L9X6_9MICO|nr:RbsD/FucU family protein [Brevibacterium siliguriense]SDR71102.1 L-fucose mutarotase [Brevibacterium siliguriense]
MLTTPITHPELLAALARCGHGSKILLADGNYPHVTGAPATAERIGLNVAPGLLTVDQVLLPMSRTMTVESCEFMLTADSSKAPAVTGYEEILPGVSFIGHERFAFYDAAREPDVAVVIATGDERQYANLLLTVGVVTA